jgi:diguanylate cyclase (GGDEF)-like protein
VFADSGLVCRWGGDEFAGYWFGAKAEMISAVDQFFASIHREPAFIVNPITISMGVTMAQTADSVQSLIYRADQALYQAKGAGKNRYCFLDGPVHQP